MPTVPQPARPSLGWDIVGERYGQFYVENFRRVTGLPKCKSISIKIGICILGCMIYKTAYSLKQFLPPMLTMATLKHRLPVYLHRCASRCARVWLWRHGSSLRGGSVSVWSLFTFWYSIVPMHKNTGICIYVTENTILWLYFHSCLNWLSFHKTIKYSNSRHTFWKISHSLPIAHVK